MIIIFEVLLNYHRKMSYKDNCDLWSKFQAGDKNEAVLHDLIKELTLNLKESQEL